MIHSRDRQAHHANMPNASHEPRTMPACRPWPCICWERKEHLYLQSSLFHAIYILGKTEEQKKALAVNWFTAATYDKKRHLGRVLYTCLPVRIIHAYMHACIRAREMLFRNLKYSQQTEIYIFLGEVMLMWTMFHSIQRYWNLCCGHGLHALFVAMS